VRPKGRALEKGTIPAVQKPALNIEPTFLEPKKAAATMRAAESAVVPAATVQAVESAALPAATVQAVESGEVPVAAREAAKAALDLEAAAAAVLHPVADAAAPDVKADAEDKFAVLS